MNQEIVKVCKVHGTPILGEMYKKVRNRCKLCAKEYRENNIEKIRKREKEYRAEYVKNNKEKANKCCNISYHKNKEKYLIKQAKLNHKYVDDLTDPYIIRNLKRRGYAEEDITKNIIELNRSTIMLKRKIKEIKCQAKNISMD